ncbi:uncharacterized protein [Argopecten irradians]|uniref:uncharacterized protein n=1 Tax=Argopecten irradians TaxID=31199 RepID=UPI0037117E18
MEPGQRRSISRSKSVLKKDKSRSTGGSLFSCTRGERDDTSLVDSLEHQLRLKTLENGKLKQEKRELEEIFASMIEQMKKTFILKNCKYAICGDMNIVEKSVDKEKLDEYMETVIKALNEAAEEHRSAELTSRRLEETIDNMENKVNLMEAHFSDLNATLTRDFSKVAIKLTQHNLDIAEQFKNLRTLFDKVQSTRMIETWEGNESRTVEGGIRAIKDMVGETAEITASRLPIPARKLNKMLTEKYGKIPVELEILFTSNSKGYYDFPDTFNNTVARWLVGWVRKNPENTADVLLRELGDLDRLVSTVGDDEG